MSQLADIMAKVQAGRERTDRITVDALGGAEIEVRQLTAWQWHEIDARAEVGTRFGVGPDLELAKIRRAQWDADLLLIELAVVDAEPWKRDKVGDLPDGAVEEIAEKVRGLRPAKEERAEARTFRGDGPRPDGAGVAPRKRAPRAKPKRAD